VNHAHDRRHDAECWHRIAHLGDDVDRHFAFAVVGFDLVIHQVLDLEGVQVAADHEPQVVGDELENVMIREYARVLREELALLGLLHVGFDRHEAFLAHFGEHVVEQRHQVHVHGLTVRGTFEGLGQRL
jgi:hypothetical protein